MMKQPLRGPGADPAVGLLREFAKKEAATVRGAAPKWSPDDERLAWRLLRLRGWHDTIKAVTGYVWHGHIERGLVGIEDAWGAYLEAGDGRLRLRGVVLVAFGEVADVQAKRNLDVLFKEDAGRVGLDELPRAMNFWPGELEGWLGHDDKPASPPAEAPGSAVQPVEAKEYDSGHDRAQTQVAIPATGGHVASGEAAWLNGWSEIAEFVTATLGWPPRSDRALREFLRKHHCLPTTINETKKLKGSAVHILKQDLVAKLGEHKKP